MSDAPSMKRRGSRKSPPPLPLPQDAPVDGEVVFPPPGKWQSTRPSSLPPSPLPESPTSRAATCNNELHNLTGQASPHTGGAPTYGRSGSPTAVANAAAMLPKTQICSNWPGNCVYGDQCVFAHGEHELQPAPPPAYSPPPTYQEFVASSPAAMSPAALSPAHSTPTTPRGSHLQGPDTGSAPGSPPPGFKTRYRNDPYSPTSRAVVTEDFGEEAAM